MNTTEILIATILTAIFVGGVGFSIGRTSGWSSGYSDGWVASQNVYQ